MAFSKNAFIALLIVTFLGESSVRAACTEDFSPCTCSGDAEIWNISCDNVRLSDIKNAFDRTSHIDFGSLSIAFSSNDSSVTAPADLVSGKTFNDQLFLTCPNSNHVLKVDSNAFGSSNKFFKVQIEGCNFGEQLDLAFMAGFEHLRQIWMFGVSNLRSFAGLPSHSKLFQMFVTGCRDFDLLDGAPVALPGLQELHLHNNGLDDVMAERALFALTGSADSLQELRLYENQLTAIPPSVRSLRHPFLLFIYSNQIRVLTAGSLDLTTDSGSFELQSNLIERVEAGAFGSGVGRVDLAGNLLTKFESAAFKSLLESYEARGSGQVRLAGNGIDCDCHLKWLIKDNRHLMKYVDEGTCRNSTSFNDLSPDSYEGCPTDEFNCPAIDGNYSAGPCENYYFACSGGYAYKMYCPENTVFDGLENMCVYGVGCP